MPHVYCTQLDMTRRFSEKEIIQLTDKAMPRTGVIDVAVLDLAISDATAMIDGYIQGRVKLPMANVPEVLTIKACDIARYYLIDDHATDHIVRRYEDAIRYLKQVANGQVSLALASDGSKPVNARGAEMVSGGRVFGRDNSKGFI